MDEQNLSLAEIASTFVPCTNCGEMFNPDEMIGHDAALQDEVAIWYCDPCIAKIKSIFPDDDSEEW